MSHDAPVTGATGGKIVCATSRGTYMDGLAPPSLSPRGTLTAAGISSRIPGGGTAIPAGVVWITSPHLYASPKFKERAAVLKAIVMASIYCPAHEVSVLNDGKYVLGTLVEDCCGCGERREPAASTDTGGPKVKSQASRGKFGLTGLVGKGWRYLSRGLAWALNLTKRRAHLRE